MADDFDPYLHWLGIRDPQRPPNHYRLLGVELFENDPVVLAHAADRQMAHVRTFQSGRHSAVSQRLLNEIASAKVCLLNAQRKTDYDARLRTELAPRGPVPPERPIPPVGGAPAVTMPPAVAPPGWSGEFSSGGFRPAGTPPPTFSADKPGWAPPPIVASAPLPARESAADKARPAPKAFGSQGVSMVMAGLSAVILVLVGLIVFYLYRPQRSSENPPVAAATTGGDRANAASSVAAERHKTPSETAAPAKGATPSGKPASAAVTKVEPAAKPTGETPPPAKPEGEKPAPSAAKPDAKPAAKPDAKVDAPAGAMPGGAKPEAKLETAKPDAAKPEAMTVARALAAARDAMRLRDRKAAAARVADAWRVAAESARPEDKAAVKDFQTVSDYWDTFWLKYDKTAPTLKPGLTLTVDEKAITIVSTSVDGATIRLDGKETKYTRQELPLDIVAAIVLPRFPDQIMGELARAAALCYEKLPNLPEVQKIVDYAAAKGRSAGEILVEAKLAAGVPASQRASAPLKRLPVPEAAAVEAKLAEVHETFKKDYAKPADKRQQLPRLLFQKAMDAKDDPALRYACYLEAMQQALELGDLAVHDQAARALSEGFEVDELALKVQALQETAKRVKSSLVRQAIVRQALAMVPELLHKDDFETAGGLADLALALARQIDFRPATKEAVGLRTDIDAGKQLHPKFVEAAALLKKKPDDLHANLVAGQYLCFVRNDWEAGLPLLAKGSDTDLKKLAEAEESSPGDAAELIKVGDLWWDAAKAFELNPHWFRMRAAYWYRQQPPKPDNAKPAAKPSEPAKSPSKQETIARAQADARLKEMGLLPGKK